MISRFLSRRTLLADLFLYATPDRLGLEAEDVEFCSKGGGTLRGWLLRGPRLKHGFASMRTIKADVFSGRPSCRGKNQTPRNGDGRAELEREFAAEESHVLRGPFRSEDRSADPLSPRRNRLGSASSKSWVGSSSLPRRANTPMFTIA